MEMNAVEVPSTAERIRSQRSEHAQAISSAGSIAAALAAGTLPMRIDTTLAEAIVLGLLRQGVTRFLCILGHGSTEVGEVLRIYEAAGLLRMINVRHETAASHAAAALRWVSGQTAAVVTSIGPGALQALAGSLVPASDGLGVWYLFGDETTEDEGPNMQQIPRDEQGSFLRLCSAMGDAYSLHTPAAVGSALRRGLCTVQHPTRPGPFFLLLPLNTQPGELRQFNLRELPEGLPPAPGPATDETAYDAAARALIMADRVVIKAGGGCREAGQALTALAEAVDAAVVLSPLITGLLPYDHPRNMLVGGSKGTICGNFAMDQADVVVVAGARAVCQSDSSRTGYPQARTVININTDLQAAMHYSDTIPLVGDVRRTLERLTQRVRELGGKPGTRPSDWFRACAAERQRWTAFKEERYRSPVLHDEVWQADVLTQPAAIRLASAWARAREAVAFFDAGDVQANGFQIVEDDRLGRTFSETGASYMGFAVSAVLATALADRPFYALAFTGDGSFTMNPQILIDGVRHGARGCILLLDNRRMGAISALQSAQYGSEHATADGIAVDYVAWAKSVPGIAAFHGGYSLDSLRQALDQAWAYPGLSLIHLPVYYGPDPLGGLGAFGRWNVGNWVESTQQLRHDIGL
jgi:3D-(3,5/4)-trihydroxycyclohexane-1,2-dione acylhydrolase (decyclizing)